MGRCMDRQAACADDGETLDDLWGEELFIPSTTERWLEDLCRPALSNAQAAGCVGGNEKQYRQSMQLDALKPVVCSDHHSCYEAASKAGISAGQDWGVRSPPMDSSHSPDETGRTPGSGERAASRTEPPLGL